MDGDGIPYCTCPSGMAPILYRGTGHDEYGVYSEKAHLSTDGPARQDRQRPRPSPAPILREEEECDVDIIYFGSMENTIQEIDDIIEAQGLVSQCRVRSLRCTVK